MKDKTLLVLRHGKSDWSTGLEDFHRPLVSRGRLGSRKMGGWIRHQDLLPDTVLSSPAERARMTTVHACKAMGVRWKRCAGTSGSTRLPSRTISPLWPTARRRHNW